jgi:undecaprenyl-diphosphatase
VKKRSWFSVRIASIALSSLGMMFLLKALFKRKRPIDPLKHASGLSFPSGHAIMSVTFYGQLIYIISKTVKDKHLKISLIILLIIFIQMIGFSRVYLRVHYASDVAVGYIAGLLWLLISLEVIKKIEEYNKQANPQTVIRYSPYQK